MPRTRKPHWRLKLRGVVKTTEKIKRLLHDIKYAALQLERVKASAAVLSSSELPWRLSLDRLRWPDDLPSLCSGFRTVGDSRLCVPASRPVCLYRVQSFISKDQWPPYS